MFQAEEKYQNPIACPAHSFVLSELSNVRTDLLLKMVLSFTQALKK